MTSFNMPRPGAIAGPCVAAIIHFHLYDCRAADTPSNERLIKAIFGAVLEAAATRRLALFLILISLSKRRVILF